MPKIGFTAYLKLICLTDASQKTELKKRFLPGPKKGGRDYHQSLKDHIPRFLAGESEASLLATIGEIKRPAEQASVKTGLDQLSTWRKKFDSPLSACQPVTYVSPSGIFTVGYDAQFCIEIDGNPTAIYIWNTKKPELAQNFVYGALGVLPQLYLAMRNAPKDFGVLSLRDGKFYRLSEAGAGLSGLGDQIAHLMESRIQKVLAEAGMPSVSKKKPFEPPAAATA